MTTMKEEAVIKFELWGGPEDGLEVEVASGDQQIIVDSPSAQTARNRAPDGSQSSPTTPLPPARRARYTWSRDNKRFEWKEYMT